MYVRVFTSKSSELHCKRKLTKTLRKLNVECFTLSGAQRMLHAACCMLNVVCRMYNVERICVCVCSRFQQFVKTMSNMRVCASDTENI